MGLSQASPIQRVVVFCPSWVGDAVMALPALRALRLLYPNAKITCVCRAYVRAVLDACPWFDGLIVTRRPGQPKHDGCALAARLRRRRFDLAVLLTNSFRSGWVAAAARIPQRIGYARDHRGALLTDSLKPMKNEWGFIPTPAVDYYLGLAERLGAVEPDPTVQLFTRPADDAWAGKLLDRIAPSRPRIVLCPGAATKGDAKLWPTDRFAALADRLAAKHGGTIVLSGAPNERPLLDEVAARINAPLVNLLDHSVNLRRFKSICRLCDLMIANDTGSRHIGVASGLATVALFGPTDPEWTRLNAAHETVIRSTATDHAMTGITVDQVAEAADALLDQTQAVGR
jgi:heptosyltransferase-2